MIQTEMFWIFTGVGATLAAIALAYRIGHTVGYRQAADLTLPRFEPKFGIEKDAAEIEEAVHVEQQEEAVIQ